MEFAKYYDVTKFVDGMMEKGELDCYPAGEDKYCGVYVCMDTNDFWIARITKGYNGNYEPDENKYLVERNKIDLFDVMYKLSDLHDKRPPVITGNHLQSTMRNKAHNFINRFEDKEVVSAVAILDNEDSLCNWDYVEADSLEEAIEMIDGGYGLIDLAPEPDIER